MKFSEIIGQEEVVSLLRLMAEEGRIPHALMFTGALGYGTFPLALALASYLLGEREEGTSANIEAMLAKYQHPDLHFVYPVIKPKGTSSDKTITSDDFTEEWHNMVSRSPFFTLEDWLEMMNTENQQAQIFAAEGDSITHKLSLKSSQGGYKICIIWLPERMHTVFANKILKLLEEPPQQTVFILVSEEPQRLLETIRSRVQRIDVRRISDDAIKTALMTKRGLDSEMAERVTHIACGDWIKATTFLDTGNENREFHSMFVMLMRFAYQRNTIGMKKWADAVAGYGREKQKRLLGYFSSQVRENFMYNFRNPELVYMTEEEEQFSKNFARFVNEANVIEMQMLIDKTMVAIGQNANARMHFFDFALKMIVLILRK
jgi:DNA polymerase III subunit delta'